MTFDTDKATAAIATLEALGYTWAGGEQWKPPLGPSEDWSAGFKHGQWLAKNAAPTSRQPICSADGCNRTEPCGFACRDNGNLDKS